MMNYTRVCFKICNLCFFNPYKNRQRVELSSLFRHSQPSSRALLDLILLTLPKTSDQNVKMTKLILFSQA